MFIWRWTKLFSNFVTFVSSHRTNISAVTLDRKLIHSSQCESPGFLLNSFLSIVTRNFLASPLNLLVSFRVLISFLKIVLNSCSAANPKSVSLLKMIISMRPKVNLRFNGLIWVCQWHQKQPFRGVLIKSCSENLESNFIEVTLWRGCSPANLQHTVRRSFLRIPLEGCYRYIQ